MTVLVVAEGTKTNRHHIILKKLFKDKNLGKLPPVTLLAIICRDISKLTQTEPKFSRTITEN